MFNEQPIDNKATKHKYIIHLFCKLFQFQNFSTTNQVSSQKNQMKVNGNLFEQARKYSEKSSVKRKEKGYGSASDSGSDSDKEKGKRVSINRKTS